MIVNISEDAWFGSTIGPDQHYSKSIFRAIENGTFFLRSANKGISAIIDNKGVQIKSLNRNEAGNIEFNVPLINSESNKNDLIFFVLLTTYLFIFQFYKNKKYGRNRPDRAASSASPMGWPCHSLIAFMLCPIRRG